LKFVDAKHADMGEAHVKRELDILVAQMHADGVSYEDAVREFKRRYLLQVLLSHRGNQCKSAEELGMHRNTLSRTLTELEMDTAQIRNGLKRPVRSERLATAPARVQPIARIR
jgi:Fis family transcriptional regulator